MNNEEMKIITDAVSQAVKASSQETQNVLKWAVNEINNVKTQTVAALTEIKATEQSLTVKYNTLVKKQAEAGEAYERLVKAKAENDRVFQQVTEERGKKQKALELLALDEELKEDDLHKREELEEYVAYTQQEIKKKWAELDYNEALHKKRVKQGLQEFHKPLADKITKGEKNAAVVLMKQEEFAKAHRKETTERNRKAKTDLVKAEEEEGLASLPELTEDDMPYGNTQGETR